MGRVELEEILWAVHQRDADCIFHEYFVELVIDILNRDRIHSLADLSFPPHRLHRLLAVLLALDYSSFCLSDPPPDR